MMSTSEHNSSAPEFYGKPIDTPTGHVWAGYAAPHASPTQPADPFAGIDESTEYDATRPAVS